MRHYCRHHIQMISMKPPDSNIIQIALRFQLADGIFLRPAAVVKTHDFFHSRLLVRNYHLELIAVLMGNEQVELDRFLRLLFDLPADKEKPEAIVPTLGFPLCIEIRQLTIEAPPASPAPDHTLKLCKPLKRHRYRNKLDPLGVERCDNLVAEEGAVHAHLDDNAGTGSENNTCALNNKLNCDMGVLNIAG